MKIESVWVAKAKALLAPFIDTGDTFKARAGEILLSQKAVTALEHAIADALVDANNEGVGDGKGY
jgi:hypothetical protein